MSRRASATVTKTIKITPAAFERLKKLKIDDLSENSYTNAVKKVYSYVKDILPKPPIDHQEIFKKIDSTFNAIFEAEKTQEEEQKTIIIHNDAHKILTDIKYTYQLRTLSDALDFLFLVFNEQSE
jgi:predicted CopG family antitoxin